MTSGADLAQNLRIYRQHQVAAGALFWGPTVFLFLLTNYGLRRALVLQGGYYLTVVVLEVPSGWLSDRWSRTRTLRAAALAMCAAHLCFLLSNHVAGIAVAQILLGAGYALLSGTDVTIHFDTLAAMDRSEEFLTLEARSRKQLLLVTAATSVAGGALAMIDLRLPFAASLVAAIVQATTAWKFVEPATTAPVLTNTEPPPMTRVLSQPLIVWLLLYTAGQVLVVHSAAEMAGPYFTLALGGASESVGLAALLAGALAGSVALIAAGALTYLEPAITKFGLAAVLLSLAVIPVAIVTAMALTSTIWIVPVLSLRRVQGAAASVIVPALVGGHVAKHYRATFLSLASLTGRLLYAGLLFTLAALTKNRLDLTLGAMASVGVVVFLVVALLQRRISNFPTAAVHSHSHSHALVTHDHPHSSDQHHQHLHR